MGVYMSAVDTVIARERIAGRGGSTSTLQLQGSGLGPGFASGQGLDANNSSGNPWYGLNHPTNATSGGMRTGGGIHPPSPGGMKKRSMGGPGFGPNGNNGASPKVRA